VLGKQSKLVVWSCLAGLQADLLQLIAEATWSTVYGPRAAMRYDIKVGKGKIIKISIGYGADTQVDDYRTLDIEKQGAMIIRKPRAP